MSNVNEQGSFKAAVKQLGDLPEFCNENHKSKLQWVTEEYDGILALREKGYPFSIIAQKISELMPEDSGISATTLSKHFNSVTKERRRQKRLSIDKSESLNAAQKFPTIKPERNPSGVTPKISKVETVDAEIING